jgi:antitoxin component of MazEF toxin-antitoxin module
MPHEEIRKIIRVGNSYAVTMPRAWLRYFKLSAKDDVVVISDGMVQIRPAHKKKASTHEESMREEAETQ